jgi:hypothetical protein
MYFIKQGSMVCHILEDVETGSAPAPCGTTADPQTIVMYRLGRPAPGLQQKKPADVPLCKHCQKAERWMRDVWQA